MIKDYPFTLWPHLGGFMPVTIDNEHVALKVIEKEFLRILDTTTLAQRLFEDGPREYAIQFGPVVYCAHDGKGNDAVRSYGSTLDFNHAEDAIEYVQRMGRANRPEVKNHSFVEPRENVIPDKKEMDDRRRKRENEIFEETSKLSQDIINRVQHVERAKREGKIFYETNPGEKNAVQPQMIQLETHFIKTRCVYEKAIDKKVDYETLNLPEPKPELKIMPYVFDLANVVAYRELLEDDGTAPYTVIYFENGETMTIDVKFKDFDHMFVTAHQMHDPGDTLVEHM